MRTLTALLPLLLACGDKDNDTSTDDSGDTSADAAFVPDLPTAQCGMPGYSWQSTAEMGALVAFDDQEGLTFSADSLNTIIQSVDSAGVVGEVENGVETYFVRYQTQDRGDVVEATGMVVVPDVEGDAPVLLWLHPTMGFSDSCSPTATGLEGAAFPMLFAAMGFIVVAPDYLGMSGYAGASGQTHPYIIGEPTAIASLDALRAFDRLAEQVSLPVTPRRDQLVLWGASQGGFAALWADRYLPHYVKNYEPIAVIAAIPPTDMLALGKLGVQSPGPTTLALAAAQVTMNDWYQTDRPLDEVFVDGMGDVLTGLIAEECSDFAPVDEVSTVEELFTADYIAGIAAGSMEPWTCFLEESTLRESPVPHETDTPVLMVLAEEDDLAIAAPARDDITALCDQGYTIEHIECAGLGHVDGAVKTLQRQLAWAQARIAGEDWDPSRVCVIHEPEDCEAGEE